MTVTTGQNIYLLRGAEDLNATGSFSPTTSSSTLIINECGQLSSLTTTDDVHEALAAGSIGFRAAVGKRFQTNASGSWSDVSPATEYGPLLVRSLTVVEHPDKRKTWLVQIEETGMGSPLYLTDTPTGAPDLAVNQTTRARTVPAWRADYGNLILGADSLVQPSTDFYFDSDEWAMCDSTSDDAIGVPIDVGGKPISYAVNQRHISIEYVVRSPYLEWDGTWSNGYKYDEALALAGDINKRNAEALFGFGVGELLLADVAVQPLHHEFKRVVISLVWDAWKHADQRPWVTKSGVVATIDQCETSQTADLVNLQAEVVWWSQPYLSAFTFGSQPGSDFPQMVWVGIWEKLGSSSSSYSAATVGGG